MSDSVLELPGLDAQNPLGFLAALGLLRVLDDHCRKRELVLPRLAFANDGSFQARLHTRVPYPGLKDVILSDAEAQAASAALQLAYDDAGGLCAPASRDATRDLKPSPQAARDFLAAVASSPRREADLASGFFSELVQDNNGNTKPTALHFTAGQQTFLSMVESLRAGMTGAGLDEALLGPWRNTSPLPSLSWDASVTRLYALRASDPSGEKRGSVPAANWLAVHALAYFPVFARRGRLQTTAVEGGWKDSVFTWPCWEVAASVQTITALLRSSARGLAARQRSALGIIAVFACGITRSDQGGYGSFTPADVIAPRA